MFTLTLEVRILVMLYVARSFNLENAYMGQAFLEGLELLTVQPCRAGPKAGEESPEDTLKLHRSHLSNRTEPRS